MCLIAKYWFRFFPESALLQIIGLDFFPESALLQNIVLDFFLNLPYYKILV